MLYLGLCVTREADLGIVHLVWITFITGNVCRSMPQMLLLAQMNGWPRSGKEEGICFLWWRRQWLRSSELNSRLLPLCQQEQWYVRVLHALFLCSNHIFLSSRASPSYWEPCLTTENWKTSPLPLLSGWAALSSVQGARTHWQPTTALNPCPLSQKRGNPDIKSSPYSIAMKKVRCLLFPCLLVFFYCPCKFW